MSKFLSSKIKYISPYIPGEQPKTDNLLKLNTNENPYPPEKCADEGISSKDIASLRLYSDPEAYEATLSVAKYYGLGYDNVLLTNGSDEAIAFSFLCFGERGLLLTFVTYTFYKHIASLFNIAYTEVGMNGDLTIPKEKLYNAGKCVVLANPNAQTGIAMTAKDIEKILVNNKDSVVIVDQAYIDFAPAMCNAIPLIDKYENLIVIGTFSKSRSLAGARLGFVLGQKELLEDVKRVKNSFNPYNVNALTQKLCIKSIKDDKSFKNNTEKVIFERERLKNKLECFGFKVLPSSSNFLSARHEKMSAESLYEKLAKTGIFVRHIPDGGMKDYLRITVGTEKDTDRLLNAISGILGEI